jgi:CheY-like chemotaxis protein
MPALQILRGGQSIDLVITDQAMPNMTGLQLAEVIRVEWPTLPVILPHWVCRATAE